MPRKQFRKKSQNIDVESQEKDKKYPKISRTTKAKHEEGQRSTEFGAGSPRNNNKPATHTRRRSFKHGRGSRRGSHQMQNVQGPSPLLKVLSRKTDQQIEIFFDPDLCTTATPSQKGNPEWRASHLYTPALILKVEEQKDHQLFVVKTQENEIHKFPVEGVKEVVEQAKQGLPDILQLNDFSQESLLHTLRVRYGKGLVYTFVGPILISINPYKWDSALYSEERMMKYHGAKYSSMEPHLFVVADRAYSALAASGGSPQVQNQSIIISGESGAGKTEATKIIMQYLARITMHSKREGDAVGRLEDQVLSANPLLESFGNACTLRNDNSSRFGKYIFIQFDPTAKIVGAKVRNYLLEKTRIIGQMEGERNYHIFYQLFRGADDSLKEELQLGECLERFNYLNQSRHTIIEGRRSDKEEFAVTCHCLEMLDIGVEMRKQIFALLSAVLHIGNIEFEMNEDGDCLVSGESRVHMETCCQLLQLPPESLTQALCTKQLTVRNQIMVQKQTVEQATDKRDALAKALYSGLFEWLVGRLNSTIAHPDPQTWGFIGVLDIYGFEIFEVNSFEQLLINYANEKLQRHFNRHIFEMEQDEYASEGIDWRYVKFNDNQACLDLIEGKPNNTPGVLAALDDTQFFGSGNTGVEQKYLAKLHQGFGSGSSAHYIVPRFNKDTHFGILHYAGEVHYAVEGFHDKNTENLSNDVKDVLRNSDSSLVGEVCSAVLAGEGMGGALPKPSTLSRQRSSGQRLRASSVGNQFKVSLNELIDTVSQTQPHFIRCIKPNQVKLPDALDALEVLRQLKYAGMMETIRIRQQGYALREDHEVFYMKFKALDPSAHNAKALVASISEALSVNAEDWQMGHSKVFMRKTLALALERLVSVRLKLSCRIIQRHWRHYRGRLAVIKLQSCWRAKNQRSAFLLSRVNAMKVQCFIRSRLRYLKYSAQKRSAVTLQSQVRRFIAIRKYLKMQDPFAHLCAEELNARAKECQRKLKEALESKNYSICGDLEAELEKLKTHPNFVEIEDDPYAEMSNEDLNKKAKELRLKLKDALDSKNFSVCQNLQEELDKIQKHPNFVVIEDEMDPDVSAIDLNKQAKETQAKLQAALDSNDFNACQQLQAELEIIQSHPNFVEMEDEMDPDVSALDLNKQAKETQTKLQAALDSNDFNACQQLQAELERIQSHPNFVKFEEDPNIGQSTEDLKNRAKDIRSQLQRALQSKNFTVCQDLQEELDSINQLLENRGVPIEEQGVDAAPEPVISRHELEVQILAMEFEMNDALSAKDFVLCQSLQSNIDDLKSKKEEIPTFEGLSSSLEGAKIRLEEALATKNFGQCGAINAEIEALTQALDTVEPENDEFSTSYNDQHSHLQAKLEDALAQKNFDLCGQLQEELTELDGLLKDQPTDIDLALQEASRNMMKSKENKDYTLQAELTINLQRLNQIKKWLPKPTEVQKVSEPIPPNKTLKQQDSKTKDQRPVTIAKTQVQDTVNPEPHPQKLEALDEEVSILSDLVSVPSDRSKEDVVTKSVNSKPPTLAALKNPSADFGVESMKIRIAQLPQEPQLKIRTTSSHGSPTSSRGTRKTKSQSSSVKITTRPRSFASKNGSANPSSQKIRTEPLQKDERPVRKLRPKPAVFAKTSSTILHAAKAMATKRMNAVLLRDGHLLEGIVTSNDIVKTLAKSIDPARTSVTAIMTSDPRTVSMEDSALEALALMVEHGFHNLPVMDEDGDIAGVLDISKCLYDAISRLESLKDAEDQGHEKDKHEAAKLMASNLHKMKGKRSMQSLFKLVGQVFDGDHPTLENILAKKPRPVFIQPMDTIREVTKIMMQTRTAALVVEDGELQGILTPKDVLNRVVAKGRNADTTLVEVVMTSHPDTFPPEMELVDAMHQMHDLKYSHLPVVHPDTGEVMGIVGVKDILEATMGDGGDKGWRKLFGASLETHDVSDSVSLRSETTITSRRSRPGRKRAPQQQLDPSVRPVSKLRPVMPALVPTEVTIAEVAQVMAKKRTDSALLTNEDQSLAGILTDTDIVRRVVARSLRAEDVEGACAMTPSPMCVHLEDGALDALATMVENGFRHLPVTDDAGCVVGMLDIAKCLYDAVSKMEKLEGGKAAQETSDSSTELKLLQSAVSKAKDVEAVKGMLAAMQKMFGSSVPTLQDILAKKKSQRFVGIDSTILDAAKVIASTKTAVLVIDRGSVAGIITPKDILHRVIAQELDPTRIKTSKIMTPNPDIFPPEMTLVDALHEMHDHKYLHLPVVQTGTGNVLGVIDVMDVVSETMGSGEDGTGGWRSFFGATMDYELDSTCEGSSKKSTGSIPLSRASQKSAGPRKSKAATLSPTDIRPVSRLRPKRPVIGFSSETVWDASKRMTGHRSDVTLLVDQAEEDGPPILAGIFTANDIVRRVVAQDLDVNLTEVSSVLTANLRCVRMEDCALKALMLMVENRFQHLPVTDEEGNILGILDIAKCLYDAISRMEKVAAKTDLDTTEVAEQMATSLKRKAHTKGMQNLLGSLLQQAFGSSIPTAADVLEQRACNAFVPPDASVFKACSKMAKLRTAILVVERRKLVGILTPKDILNKVVTPGLCPRQTLIKDVMTPAPDSFPPEISLVDAMHQMHDQRYLHLPIVSSSGEVLGLIDVMDVVEATMGDSNGTEGWASFFQASMDADVSDTSSSISNFSRRKGKTTPKKSLRPVSKLRLSKVVSVAPETPLLQCCEEMSKRRTDVLLVKAKNKHLAGIFTDSDLVHEVIAKYLDIEHVRVKEVMTLSPKYMKASDGALEAMTAMVQNRIRHLPIINDDGGLAGVLDVEKCLYDAISVLEKLQLSLEQGDISSHPLAQDLMSSLDSSHNSFSEELQSMLAPILRNLMPTVKDLLGKQQVAFIRPTDNIREAAVKMSETKQALLVIEDGVLVGLLTPNMILKEVIGKKMRLDFTAVSSVMESEPDVIDPSESLLETLHHMHNSKCHYLPVVDTRGRIHGLVSILDIIESSMGGENGLKNWEWIINSELQFSEKSGESCNSDVVGNLEDHERHSRMSSPNIQSSMSGNSFPKITVRSPALDTSSNFFSDISQDISHSPENNVFVYKVTNAEGMMHRIKSSSDNVDELLKVIGKKLNIQPSLLVLTYTDDEGDSATISCSESLLDAVEHAKSSGAKALKLKVAVTKGSFSKSTTQRILKLFQHENGELNKPLIGGSIVAAATISVGAAYMLRRRNRHLY